MKGFYAIQRQGGITEIFLIREETVGKLTRNNGQEGKSRKHSSFMSTKEDTGASNPSSVISCWAILSLTSLNLGFLTYDLEIIIGPTAWDYGEN